MIDTDERFDVTINDEWMGECGYSEMVDFLLALERGDIAKIERTC